MKTAKTSIVMHESFPIDCRNRPVLCEILGFKTGPDLLQKSNVSCEILTFQCHSLIAS